MGLHGLGPAHALFQSGKASDPCAKSARIAGSGPTYKALPALVQVPKINSASASKVSVDILMPRSLLSALS